MTFAQNLLMMGQSGAEGAQGGGGSMFFLMIAATFGILYFLVIRPQHKEQQRQKQLIGNLSRGDDVVTAGGIYGRIIDLDEHTVDLKIAEGTKRKIERARIGRVVAKASKGA